MSTKNKLVKIRGAKTHNLKNVSLDIPINKITCISGPSGSGKSSLAFHTLLVESRRRFLNSLPNDVKFFWNMPQSADVDKIEPILPVWGLAQNNPIVSSRPNIADTIGLSELLQKYFFDFGMAGCSEHKVPFRVIDIMEELEASLNLYGEDKVWHVLLRKEDYKKIWKNNSFPSRSYGESEKIRAFAEEDSYWEAFRFKSSQKKLLKKRINEIGEQSECLFVEKKENNRFWFKFSGKTRCSKCAKGLDQEVSVSELSPYNAAGACQACSGHGMTLDYSEKKIVKNPFLSINEGAIHLLNSAKFSYLLPIVKRKLEKEFNLDKPFIEIENKKIWNYLWNGEGNFPGLTNLFEYLETKKYKKSVRIYLRSFQEENVCESCCGSRISKKARGFLLKDKNKYISYEEILKMNILSIEKRLSLYSKDLINSYQKKRIKKIVKNLEVAINLNLGRLPLWKKAKYTSNSEYQRSLLCKILSYEGSGSMFILDEPSLSLSLKEQKNIFKCLKELKKQGNTIVLVEHSDFFKNKCDFQVEMGPGAGIEGGRILKKGFPKKRKVLNPLKPKKIDIKKSIVAGPIVFEDLKLEKIVIPFNKITQVRGDSDTKKEKFILNKIANTLYFNKNGSALLRVEDLEDNIKINFEYENVFTFESKLNRSSGRSTVGTVLGISPFIRKYFSTLPVSKSLRLEAGHFSSNSDLGKCPTCEGRGITYVDMNFLEDMILSCEDCKGMKLRPFYATITNGEFTVNEAFTSPLNTILPKIKMTPKYQRIWSYLKELKLDYLSLDRSLSSLSGGERQRVKLLAQLQKDIKNSLIFFENLSSGLGEHEVLSLSRFLQNLISKGNTIILIDESPHFSRKSDHLIDFSPKYL